MSNVNNTKKINSYYKYRPQYQPVKSSQPAGQPPKMMDRLRAVIALKQLSHRTAEAYVSCCIKFIAFHKMRNPIEMRAPEIEAFLTYLATARHVSASTQNLHFNAILFLYRNVLQIDPGKIDAMRAKTSRRLPVVLTKEEVKSMLDHLRGVYWIIAMLLYGSGLRIEIECLKLRVKHKDALAAKDAEGKIIAIPAEERMKATHERS